MKSTEMSVWQQERQKSALDVDSLTREAPKSFGRAWKEWLVATLSPSSSVDYEDIKRHAWVVGLTNLSLYIFVFFYLLVTVTDKGLHSKFLALSAPPENDATCEMVPFPITGTFRSDILGQWSTAKKYTNNPVYELSMTGTTVTLGQFSSAMQRLADQAAAVGARQATQDTITAQLAWALFRSVDKESNMQLTSTASLGNLFKGSTFLGHPPALASKAGVCQNTQLSTLEPAILDASGSTVMRIIMPAAPPSAAPASIKSNAPSPPPSPSYDAPSVTFDSYEACPEQLWVLNGTFGLYHGRRGPISAPTPVDVDLISAALAYMLNWGLFNTTHLTLVSSDDMLMGPQLDEPVHVERWLHDTYPNMLPVSCVTPKGRTRVCLSPAGASMIYPVFSTVNHVATPSLPCLCPATASTPPCGSSSSITSTFNIALLFSRSIVGVGTLKPSIPPTDSAAATSFLDLPTYQVINAGLVLQKKGPEQAKKLVSTLSFASQFLSPEGQGLYSYQDWVDRVPLPFDPPRFGNVTSLSEFAAAMDSLESSISLLSVNLDYAGADAALNAEGTSLSALQPNASKLECSDTLFQQAAFQRMAATPPVPVVQAYLECAPTLWSAVVSALGIAAANSALVSSFFCGAALFLVVFWVSRVHEDRQLLPPSKKLVAVVQRDEREKKEIFARLAALEQQLSAMRSVSSGGGVVVVDRVPPPAPDNPIHHRS